MIAPPKRPPQDELDALIKEARARQLRRRLLGAAGVAIAAAIGLGIYAILASGPQRTVLVARGGPQAAARCGVAGGWRLGINARGWSEPTGQHTAPLVVTRIGTRSCTLNGYPTIVLLDAHRHKLNFRYSHREDFVVARKPPHAVHVSRSRSAFFLFNKWRCDIRALSVARWLRVELPGVRGWLILRLSYPIIDYCPAEPPSRTIAVSPIVAALTQAAAERQ